MSNMARSTMNNSRSILATSLVGVVSAAGHGFASRMLVAGQAAALGTTLVLIAHVQD